MTQAIVFPPAVATMIDYLRSQLAHLGDSAPVVHAIPDPRPGRFVHVLRTGGVRHTVVTDAAQLTLECWADRPDHAEALAQTVRALVNAMSTRSTWATVYLVEEASGPAELPDLISNQSRYTWSVLVHLRGSPL
jgi:hypothetical protein